MTARPELSIQLRNFAESPQSWSSLFEMAQIAERSGVDRVVVSDHVALGEHLDAYTDPSLGGIAGGRQPTSPDGHWLEPLTVLTTIAAQTTRVRLGTAILLAALRTPVVLAKQLATLDVLSGGRLDLGVGVGWQRQEYEACGLEFSERGAILDECLEICRRLWTEPSVTADIGRHRLVSIHSMPKPAHSGGVPVWISGRATPRTARRLGRFGVGWIPWGDDAVDPTPGIEIMRAALEDAGRDPATLQVQGSLRIIERDRSVDLAATVGAAEASVAAGVTDLRVQRRWGGDLGAAEELLTVLVPAVRSMAS